MLPSPFFPFFPFFFVPFFFHPLFGRVRWLRFMGLHGSRSGWGRVGGGLPEPFQGVGELGGGFAGQGGVVVGGGDFDDSFGAGVGVDDLALVLGGDDLVLAGGGEDGGGGGIFGVGDGVEFFGDAVGDGER